MVSESKLNGRVMANEPDLLKRLFNTLISTEGKIEIGEVREYVSSPCLAEIYIGGRHGAGLVAVADTYLDAKTMLADRAHRSFAVSIFELGLYLKDKSVLAEVHWGDKNVTRLEVWPFDPGNLSQEQLTLAVALSYSDVELRREERVTGALNGLLNPLGFYIPDDVYY